MLRELRAVLAIFSLLTIVTGLLYPGVVTVIGRAFFPDQAAGSVIFRQGQAVGSRLLGQPFSDPGYFWSRPSATASHPYDGSASAGSNLAATNAGLEEAVQERIAALRAADPGNGKPVPVDLVTASASGLDPHISPAAAEYQVARVARTRGLAEADVRALVEQATEERTFRILGEPRVNVLELNLALGDVD
jgi:K+-transporting ATPase ATPase C chain